MTELSLTYRLVPFDGSSRYDKDFERAIQIYFDETAPELRTDPDDLRKCRFNYNEKFYPDRLMQFGLRIRGQIIGFCQIVYLSAEKLIFVDYMAIAKECRGGNTFFAFVDLIRGYIHKNNFFYDFIVTEVGFLGGDGNPSLESRALVRKLRSQGFLVASFPYEQPQLGLTNPESKVRAWLLINPRRDEVDCLTASVFRRIVNTVYVHHYLRWYKLLMTDDEFTNYKSIIDAVRTDFESKMKGVKLVKLAGYREIDRAGVVDHGALVYERSGYITHFAIPALMSLFFLGVAIMVNRAFGLSVLEISAIYFVGIAGTLALLSVVAPQANNSVKSLIDVFTAFFRTKG